MVSLAAGVVVTTVMSGVGRIAGWTIIAISAGVAVSLVFLAVADGEDRERADHDRRQ